MTGTIEKTIDETMNQILQNMDIIFENKEKFYKELKDIINEIDTFVNDVCDENKKETHKKSNKKTYKNSSERVYIKNIDNVKVLQKMVDNNELYYYSNKDKSLEQYLKENSNAIIVYKDIPIDVKLRKNGIILTYQINECEVAIKRILRKQNIKHYLEQIPNQIEDDFENIFIEYKLNKIENKIFNEKLFEKNMKEDLSINNVKVNLSKKLKIKINNKIVFTYNLSNDKIVIKTLDFNLIEYILDYIKILKEKRIL